MLVNRPAATVSLLLMVSAVAASGQPAAPLGPRARVLVVAAPGADPLAVEALYGGFSVLGVPPVEPEDRLGVDEPAPAGAFEPAHPDEVRDALFAARAAFGEFDVDKARERLSAADAALLRLPSPEAHRDLFGEVLLLEAEVALASGEREAALLALKKLARLSPELAELHPGLYAPALVEAYQDARAENAAERSGTLVVLPRRTPMTAEGADAVVEVLVDGEEVEGASRTALAGPHLVTVRAEGSLTRSSWVDLDPSVPLVLEPLVVPEGAGEARREATQAIVEGSLGTDDTSTAEELLGLTGATWLVVEGASPPLVFAAGAGRVLVKEALPEGDAVARAQAIRTAIDQALLRAAANGQLATSPGMGGRPLQGSTGVVGGLSPTGDDDESEGGYATPVLAGTGVVGAAAVGTLMATATASAAWYYYAFFVPHVPPEPPPRPVLTTCCPL